MKSARQPERDEPALTGHEGADDAPVTDESSESEDDDEAHDEPMDEAKSVQVGSTQIDLSALTAHFKSVNIRGGAEGSVPFSQGDGDRVEGPPQALRPTVRSDYAPAVVTYGSSIYGPVAGEHQQVPRPKPVRIMFTRLRRWLPRLRPRPCVSPRFYV